MNKKFNSYKDFGKQFKIYNDFNGNFGKKKTIEYYIKPFDLKKIKKKTILDIGAGAGRITKNLLKFKPFKVYSLEPSEAIDVAKKNIKNQNVVYLNYKGESLDYKNKFDYIFSIGVLHHTPNIKIILEKALNALKPNGEIIFWLYGYENIKIYVFIVNILRKVTVIMPDKLLICFSIILNIFSYFYYFLCLFFKMPLKDYFIKLFNNFSFSKRNLIIFDQLNPSYTKYYSYNDIVQLTKKFKIQKLRIINKDNYSWTVIIKK